MGSASLGRTPRGSATGGNTTRGSTTRGNTLGGGIIVQLRSVAFILLGVFCGGALALLWGIFPATGGGQFTLACGSGNPVMQANSLLATLDPNTFNAGNGLPDTGGIFALDYAAGKSIAFGENLAYIDSSAPPDLKLRWNFGDNSSSVVSLAPSHTYAKAGTYLVMVDYFDTTSYSWQFFDYAHLHVVSSAALPNPPVARIAASATSLELGTNVTFDASGSKSQDGSALTYTWDFNDGTRTSGAKVTHQYIVPGKTLVQLIVTDGRGAKSVTALNLVVVPTNGLPTAAVFANTTSVQPGQSVTFDASQSHAPDILPNDQLVKYVWDFGDGTPQQTTTSPTTSHTYKQKGTFTMTLQAYDEQDAAGTTTVTVYVGTTPPSASAATSHGGGANIPLIGFGGVALAGLAVTGYYALQAQRRRNALIRARQQAMELARARRVAAKSGTGKDGQPSAPRRGPSSRQVPARRRPPEGTR